MKKIYYPICLASVGALLLFSGCSSTPSQTQAQTVEETTAVQFETAETGGAADKVPDPDAPKLYIVSVYFPSEHTGGIMKDLDAIATADGGLLWYKLVEIGAVEGDFISYTQEGKVGTIDLTGFDLSSPSQKACLTNTFIENFELDSLNVLIDGAASEDGQNLQYFVDYEFIS